MKRSPWTCRTKYSSYRHLTSQRSKCKSRSGCDGHAELPAGEDTCGTEQGVRAVQGDQVQGFESTLHKQIWSYVPEDSPTVVTSANKGFPFVMTRTETKVAKAIIDMGIELVRKRRAESIRNLR